MCLIIDALIRCPSKRKDTMRIMGRATGLLSGIALAIPILTPSVTSAAPVTQYVALAYSPLHVPGVFVGFSNALPSAEGASLKLCEKYEKGCKGAVWAFNGWVSYASVSSARGGNGFAYGSTKSFAANRALHYCTVYGGGSNCALRTVISTTPLIPRLSKGGTW